MRDPGFPAQDRWFDLRFNLWLVGKQRQTSVGRTGSPVEPEADFDCPAMSMD